MKARNGFGAAVLSLLMAAAAAAQVTKTIQGEMQVVTATVEAIERSQREVTLKKPDGKYEVIYVPQGIARFDTLKIGDTITARYYETMVLQLKAPGEKSVDTGSAAATKAASGSAGTLAHQQTITATITEINPKVPSITFSGPRGWTYSSRVYDTKALEKVKVGDKVDITWTTAAVVSIEDGK
jgi:hypothetical protein